MPNIPGLPAGVWLAGKEEEGDASGGLWTAQHIFENVSNNLGDSNYYNLEQIMVSTNQFSTNTNGEVRVTGMDPGTQNAPNLQPIDCSYGFELITSDLGLNTASIDAMKGFAPIWIGTFKGFDTEFGDVIVRLANPTGIGLISVKLQGYWWTPDAINAGGGMRRPPGAIYG